MADKQLSLRQDDEDGFFAHDDPLAALARIASFDPQGESRPRPAPRREPEFNLEDELLKEFEQYEEPAEPAYVQDTRAESPAVIAEPVYHDRQETLVETLPADDAAVSAEPEPVSPPVQPPRDMPELRAVPQPAEEPPVAVARPDSHPVFDLEDEILREFAAFDARRLVPTPVATPTRQANYAEPAASDAIAVQPLLEPVRNAAPVPPEFIHAEDAGLFAPSVAIDRVRDSEPTPAQQVETEAVPDLSMAQDIDALAAMEAEVDAGLWQEEQLHADPVALSATLDDGASDTLATVEAVELPQERWDDELSVEPAVDMPSLALDIDAEPEVDADYWEPVPAEPVSETAFSVVEPVPMPVPAVTPAAETRRNDFGLDALLADVEAYPVVPAAARTPIASAPVIVAERPAPAVEADATQAELPPVAEAWSFATPTRKAEPILTPKPAADSVVPALAVADAAAASVEKPIPDLESFDEAAFELDLTEIELDLLEMEVANSLAPALNADQITSAAPVPVANVVADIRPPSSAERAAPQPVASGEDYSALPFDPSQVTTEEDPVEAIGEFDVPEAPPVENEVHAPAKPDYDIDIDAEMAHLFTRPSEPVQPAADRPAQSKPAASEYVDLDEFERALEEDFRRSISENNAYAAPDRVALTPSSVDIGPRETASGRRVLVLAASVAGLALIGGAALYAYWGGAPEILSASTEPKIILAAKDPVKVAPVDRGGQVVPNQDKAVYDRVSGDQEKVAKQDQLLTSNEEPVDVVQKTLMPEALPLDEDQASATDTGDTTDPRLLPENKATNVSTENATDGVSPRKVRTMVVRSDGTLVPRDEEPADTASDQTPAEASQDRPLEITPAASENVPERLAANDDIAKQIKEADADSKNVMPPAATDTAKADATDTAKADVTDSNTEAAAKDTPAPVDTTDTAKQPDVAPVEKQDLAAAAPADDSQASATADTANSSFEVKLLDQAAIDKAASAQVDTEVAAPVDKDVKTPIPQVRPVDQPVDIVGKVDNQADAQQTREVASAEPVQTTTTPPGTYVIQIASLPSAAEAQASYAKLSVKFANVIGGRGVDIKKAAIKNKGTYFRVRIPAGSREEATNMCLRYKAAGGSCLVSK
jgi:hypothetical protein